MRVSRCIYRWAGFYLEGGVSRMINGGFVHGRGLKNYVPVL